MHFSIIYIIELIALGLIGAALLAVTYSIYTRRNESKLEYKKIKLLRQSAEQDKELLDKTSADFKGIGEQLRKDAQETNEQLVQAFEKANEIHMRAETIATIEQDMMQLAAGTTDKMQGIQDYWEQQLKTTTTAMDQINTNLESGLKHSTEQNEKTHVFLKKMSDATDNDGQSISEEIKQTLDLSLSESKALLAQIKDYKLQAESAYTSLSHTLGNFESQAHEQFDEIFNTADMARQELNANLDESREYMKIFRNKKQAEKKTSAHSTKNTNKKPWRTTPPPLSKGTPRQVENARNNAVRYPTPIRNIKHKAKPAPTRPLKTYGLKAVAPVKTDKNLITLFSNLQN